MVIDHTHLLHQDAHVYHFEDKTSDEKLRTFWKWLAEQQFYYRVNDAPHQYFVLRDEVTRIEMHLRFDDLISDCCLEDSTTEDEIIPNYESARHFVAEMKCYRQLGEAIEK